MKLTGKITHDLGLTEGEGKNGLWAKREIIIEEVGEQYPNTIKAEIFKSGEHIEWIKDKWAYKVGDEVIVELKFKTTDWNGKHFTNISIWNIEKKLDMNSGGVAKKETDDLNILPF